MPEKTRKEHLYIFCQTFVKNRIGRITTQIKEIQTALSSETKSSAGDKHETGRAMLQLEREKLGHQLAEAEKMQQVLAKVKKMSNTNMVSLGNLIQTSKNDYYLGVSAGEFKADKKSIYCISVGTPIGQLLLGKSVGDEVFFNGQKLKILEIS